MSAARKGYKVFIAGEGPSELGERAQVDLLCKTCPASFAPFAEEARSAGTDADTA